MNRNDNLWQTGEIERACNFKIPPLPHIRLMSVCLVIRNHGLARRGLCNSKPYIQHINSNGGVENLFQLQHISYSIIHTLYWSIHTHTCSKK